MGSCILIVEMRVHATALGCQHSRTKDCADHLFFGNETKWRFSLAPFPAHPRFAPVSYTVFARKYRPKTFADVLGQDHVVRTLQNAISQNRLAQAYLFVGPRGTGKTSTARIFAKALNCTGGPKMDFDPDEPVCVEIAEGRSLDVLEIDGASNNGVEQVRELREQVHFAPAQGQFRIFYIDEVHMLSTAAFNALLKTLEEPPPHVKFIFATTEAHKILPTILSRCQRFDLRRIATNIIADHLLHIATLENVKLDRLAAHAIARGADGGMRDAQSMLDQLVAFCGAHIQEEDVMHIFGFTSQETVANLSDKILRNRTPDALSELHAQAESGKDLSKLLADLIFHFRNVLVYQVDPAVAMKELPPEMAGLMETQSKLVSNDKLMNLLDQFAEVEAGMRWAPNKRLCFEIGIIKASQTLSESTLNDIILALNGALGNAPQVSLPAALPMSEPVVAQRVTAPTAAAAAPEKVAAPISTPPPAAVPVPKVEPIPAAKMDPENGIALWAAALDEIDRTMPLTSSWAAAGVFHEIKGSKFVVYFHPDHAIECESIQRPSTKTEIESILKKLCGRDFDLVPAVSSSVVIAPPTPDPVEQIPEVAPEPVPEPEPVKPPEPAKKAAPVDDEKARQAQIEAEFRNDPFIREALDLFEAKIQ